MAPSNGAAAQGPRAQTLVLLRHAKAESPNGLADADRPLSDRGHVDAAAAGAWLVNHGYVPDFVLCSPAKRTRQTWHSVAVAIAKAGSPEVHYERAIYEGGADDLLKLLQTAAGEHRVVLVIGHNPTISQLSALLDPESGADSDGLRTCGIAVHTAEESWADLQVAKLAGSHTARAEG